MKRAPFFAFLGLLVSPSQGGHWVGIFAESPASEVPPQLGPSHTLLEQVRSGSLHFAAESPRPPEQAPPHTAGSWPPGPAGQGFASKDQALVFPCSFSPFVENVKQRNAV